MGQITDLLSLGWLLLAVTAVQVAALVVLAARVPRPGADRTTALLRVLDAASLVVLVRLVGPWDTAPPLLWAVLVAVVVWGAARVAGAWRVLERRAPRGGAATASLVVSGLVSAALLLAAGWAAAVALGAGMA